MKEVKNLKKNKFSNSNKFKFKMLSKRYKNLRRIVKKLFKKYKNAFLNLFR